MIEIAKSRRNLYGICILVDKLFHVQVLSAYV